MALGILEDRKWRVKEEDQMNRSTGMKLLRIVGYVLMVVAGWVGLMIIDCLADRFLPYSLTVFLKWLSGWSWPWPVFRCV